ncbi:condensation domain-containing protein, partial [Tsukamurella sp. 1534]|uniref:condensation domain-containing protein n=1 Tax=Tsukamurella sp. 1534 TaxID=1151061 RepID=UPI000594AD9C
MSRAGLDIAADATTPESALPLTAAQLGIWNAQRLEPDSPYYVVGDVIEIAGEGPVDIPALGRAIAATVDEADSLRARVHETAGGPVQTIAEVPTAPPAVTDLRAEPDPRAAAERAVTAERNRMAEHCRGMVDRDLFAHRVLVLSDREVWYTQLGHHLVFDGYSAAMLSRRVAARYTAETTGGALRPSPFGDFAELVAADAEYRSGPEHEADRAFWRDRLTPLPEIPPREDVDGPPVGTLTATGVLGATVRERLDAVASASGTTWGEALIACYAAFLQRTTGVTDVVFALPLMCRVGSVALRTPAMAVNVLPLRVAVHSGDTLPELSRRIADAM